MQELLVLVGIFVESGLMDDVIDAIMRLEGVVKVYEVTGEWDLVVLVSTNGMEEFRSVLKDRIMKIKGVKSTVSSVVLSTHSRD